MKRSLLPAIALSLSLASCANIGSPDGGRYDEEPPVVTHSSPDNKSVGVKSKKINIHFNEFIKLENASEQVVISPPQTEQPNVRATDKSVKVDLYDTLRDSTTYTIDFGDAIVDNNEGNPMGKYTFSFSTGETIDTMEVSGTVLNAENLEPVKGILVGLYPADSLWSDTLFTTTPFLRVGRTNGSGQFTIKGVKDGSYHACALQDMDGNYFFSQKSETLAWDTITLHTSQKPDLRPDTVWLDTVTIDKILMVPFIHYYPDDVTLISFLEAGQDKHLLKSERPTAEHFTIYFTAPQDTLPALRGLNFDDRCVIPEPSEHNDTITYWLTDTLAAYLDTISFSLTYPDTDTLGIDQPQTDTLSLVAKMPHSKVQKQRQKQIDDWNKQHEKRIKKGKDPDAINEVNPFETVFLESKLSPGTSLAPNQNLTIAFNEPIAEVDTSKIHFYQVVDSQYVDEPYLLLPVEDNIKAYRLYAEWQSATAYQFVADSLAFTSALGTQSKGIKADLRVKSDDEFGAIFIKLIGQDEHCIVQLLDKSDKPVAEGETVNQRVDFFYLKPGDYYMRMFVDRNQNGVWDTGEYASQTQPEEVFYFPKPITLRARFEVEQEWNYRGIPRTKQKPEAITKQKADKEKSIKNRNAEREQEKQKNKRK
ncbi:MAG: Ig-like domain-containing protein [Prevotellaceae bacterium]|nr:Ig-like domain-containing protein [Prevotellaceae bacterium]